MRSRLTFLPLIPWLAVCAALTVALAPLSARAESRALLIGINEYVAVPDLRGALNDIELVRGILIDRFGFAASDIEMIVDDDATREGILLGLDRLAERTNPGDIVYLHYSGHGSQVADFDGDEADGRDETLIAQDGRTPGVPDITDDELGDKLAAIPAETLVVVLDSCHSGTATRSLGALSVGTDLLGGLRPRFVPADDRLDLYRGLRRDGTRTRSVVPLATSGHVLLTGAAFNEEALDGPVDSKLHGLFSYALAQTLRRSAPDATPSQVFSQVGREFERIRAQLSLRKMPNPQLEAEADRLEAPLFPAPSTPAPGAPPADLARLAWVGASPSGAGRARLARGFAEGATLGALWAIYPPGETRFEPGAALAEAEIIERDGADAIAQLDPLDAEVPNGARAVVIAPPPAAGDIPIVIAGGEASRVEALRTALQTRLETLRFVDSDEFARFVIRLDGDEWTVTGADGLFEIARVDASDVAGAADRLAQRLARSLTASELLALDNPSTTIDLELTVVAEEPATLSQGDERGMVLVGSNDSALFRIRRDGEPRSRRNSLQLRVRSSVECYLTVADVDSEGGVHVLFPNRFSDAKGYFEGGRLPAEQELLIPDSLQSGNAAGFHVDYAPPAGTDTVRAFCSEDARAADALRSALASLDPSGNTGSPAARGTGFDRLRRQLARLASRGMKLVPDEVAEPVLAEATPEDEAAAPIPEPPVTVPDAPDASPDSQRWFADWTASSVTIEVRE